MDNDNVWYFDDHDNNNSSSGTSSRHRLRRQVDESLDDDMSIMDGFNYDMPMMMMRDWAGVEDENDWVGFYEQSNLDFSDLRNLVRPSREELRELGHQAKDFILQCSFDTEPCSYKYVWDWIDIVEEVSSTFQLFFYIQFNLFLQLFPKHKNQWKLQLSQRIK